MAVKPGGVLNNRLGITFLELLLVMVMIGLVFALVTPFLMSSLERIDRRSEVGKIATLLRFARTQAISEKKRQFFHADIDANTYWLEARASKPPAKIFTLSPNIKFTQFLNGNGGGNEDDDETVHQGKFSIVFYPQGNTSGGKIELKKTSSDADDDGGYTISLDPVTGKPKVEETHE